MRTLLILNAKAGRFRRAPNRLDRAVALARGRADVAVCHDMDDLNRAIRQFDPGRHDRVALCGGDGTFMAGVSALVRRIPEGELPALAFVPAGTVATVARRWGGRQSLESSLHAVLERAPRSRTVPRPTLRVEADGRALCGFTFGSGLVARFFERYVEQGAGGRLAAARIFARVFWGSLLGTPFAESVLAPLPCTLEIDGTAQPASAYSLVVSSVLGDVGLGIRVTYRAGTHPGRLHVVASPLPPRRLGPQAPRVLLGRPLVGPGNVDKLARTFALDFGESAGPFVLDGDLLRARRVQVSAGPELNVVCTRPA